METSGLHSGLHSLLATEWGALPCQMGSWKLPSSFRRASALLSTGPGAAAAWLGRPSGSGEQGLDSSAFRNCKLGPPGAWPAGRAAWNWLICKVSSSLPGRKRCWWIVFSGITKLGCGQSHQDDLLFFALY
jgi:hypothetical protein